MARRLRFQPPRNLVEVTNRTLEGRFFLRPSPAVNGIVAGAFAVAARKYPVEVVSVAALTDHIQGYRDL